MCDKKLELVSSVRSITCFAIFATLLLSWNSAWALPEMAVNSSMSYGENLQVPLNKSRVINLSQHPRKISVGNADVADILILKSKQIYVLGKQLGTTNVLLWDKDHELIDAVEIEVIHDLIMLKSKLHQLLPGEAVKVHSAQGAVVLSGEVTSLVKMDTAVSIARSFVRQTAPGSEESAERTDEVINLMTVGGTHQVMLKVTVAEMSRSTMKQLGIKFNAMGVGSSNWQFGGVNGGAAFPSTGIPIFAESPIIGPAISEFVPGGMGIGDKGLFASYLSEDFLFRIAVDAAKENGEAKILAEPTLTTLSGQEAEFLSGGEFPIPVPNDDGVTVEFKEFGVGVKFVPVVLDGGQINLNLNISVSELVAGSSLALGLENSSSSFFVPSLTKRSAHSTVVLSDGQTIGIAGLISETSRKTITKFPGLGDIPVFGQLFTSQEFQKGETELVMMVTVHKAKPRSTELTRLPTDSFVDPSDLEFYLLGRTIYSKGDDSEGDVMMSEADDEGEPTLPAQTGGAESTFGHTIN